jgi:hypothetical protein
MKVTKAEHKLKGKWHRPGNEWHEIKADKPFA